MIPNVSLKAVGFHFSQCIENSIPLPSMSKTELPELNRLDRCVGREDFRGNYAAEEKDTGPRR